MVRLWETSEPVDGRELGLDDDVTQSDRWELTYRNSEDVCKLQSCLPLGDES